MQAVLEKIDNYECIVIAIRRLLLLVGEVYTEIAYLVKNCAWSWLERAGCID